MYRQCRKTLCGYQMHGSMFVQVISLIKKTKKLGGGIDNIAAV